MACRWCRVSKSFLLKVATVYYITLLMFVNYYYVRLDLVQYSDATMNAAEGIKEGLTVDASQHNPVAYMVVKGNRTNHHGNMSQKLLLPRQSSQMKLIDTLKPIKLGGVKLVPSKNVGMLPSNQDSNKQDKSDNLSNQNKNQSQAVIVKSVHNTQEVPKPVNITALYAPSWSQSVTVKDGMVVLMSADGKLVLNKSITHYLPHRNTKQVTSLHNRTGKEDFGGALRIWDHTNEVIAFMHIGRSIQKLTKPR